MFVTSLASSGSAFCNVSRTFHISAPRRLRDRRRTSGSSAGGAATTTGGADRGRGGQQEIQPLQQGGRIRRPMQRIGRRTLFEERGRRRVFRAEQLPADPSQGKDVLPGVRPAGRQRQQQRPLPIDFPAHEDVGGVKPAQRHGRPAAVEAGDDLDEVAEQRPMPDRRLTHSVDEQPSRRRRQLQARRLGVEEAVFHGKQAGAGPTARAFSA